MNQSESFISQHSGTAVAPTSRGNLCVEILLPFITRLRHPIPNRLSDKPARLRDLSYNFHISFTANLNHHHDIPPQRQHPSVLHPLHNLDSHAFKLLQILLHPQRHPHLSPRLPLPPLLHAPTDRNNALLTTIQMVDLDPLLLPASPPIPPFPGRCYRQ